jgi:hypothetical protein
VPAARFLVHVTAAVGEYAFWMNRHTLFSRLINSWCECHAASPARVRFLLGATVLDGGDTLQSLGKDGGDGEDGRRRSVRVELLPVAPA